MISNRLIKVEAESAEAIASDIELGDEARAVLENGVPPEVYLGQLIEANLYRDAILFLARALPKREAVWWAYRCTTVHRDAATVDEEGPGAALTAVRRWVEDPAEEHRRSAFQEAQRVEFKSAAAWTAVAAFWSGGSLAPPEAPVVEPEPHLTATAVRGALDFAATTGDPSTIAERYRQFLDIGYAIARDHEGWEEGSSPKPRSSPK